MPSKKHDMTFRSKVLNNPVVIYAVIIIILSLTILTLSKISFVFKPIGLIIGSIFLPILLAGVLYYLLHPLVDYLEKKKMKRSLSISLIYIAVALIITGVILLIVPPLKEQILDLTNNIPSLTDEVKVMLENATDTKWFAAANEFVKDNAGKIGENIRDNVSTFGSNLTSSITSTISTVTDVILAIAMLPILLFYLLKDGRNLPDYFVSLLPDALRLETKNILVDMNRGLSSYIRGQIIVSVCVGILLFIGYLIIGLKYALVLALIGTVTNVVPYLGPAIAVVPAAIIAVVESPFMLIKVVIVWGIAQLIESKGISPFVMGKSLNLHPVTVIFVIIIGGNLFGIVGIIFAVPGYTLLKVITTHLYKIIRLRSRFYSETEEVKE